MKKCWNHAFRDKSVNFGAYVRNHIWNKTGYGGT